MRALPHQEVTGPPGAASYVVTIGHHAGLFPHPRTVAATEVEGWIARSRTDATSALAEAQVVLESRLAAATKVVDDATAGIAARRHEAAAAASRRAAQSRLVEEMKAAVAARRDGLDQLQVAAEGLLATVREWQRIDDQRQSSEAALVSLRERTIDPAATVVDLETVVGDMLEAERMLWRADNRRSSAVVPAEARVVSARETLERSHAALRTAIAAWWADDRESERFPLVGLLPLREIQAGRSAGTERAARELEEVASSGRARRAEVEGQLAVLQARGTPEVDQAGVVLSKLRELVASGPLLLDDALADLDAATVGAVLGGLAGLAGGTGGHAVTYLTVDPRVLAWAMTLPDDVGGIAGVHLPAPQD